MTLSTTSAYDISLYGAYNFPHWNCYYYYLKNKAEWLKGNNGVLRFIGRLVTHWTDIWEDKENKYYIWIETIGLNQP